MPIFQRPIAPRPVYRAPFRPAYTPPPRVVTRTIVEPGRTVYRDRFVPGPAVTRNIYSTTYVNQGYSPEQRRAFEEGVRRREYDRLRRDEHMSDEVAQAQAQAFAAQQALQAEQLQAQQAILNPSQQQQPSAAVSPGSPGADLTPAQDQADGGGGGDSGGGGGHKLLVFGGIAAAAAIIGYVALKKRKKSSAE